MDFALETVLIIGIGDNIVEKIIEMQGGNVYAFDFDKELYPDFVGDTRGIDYPPIMMMIMFGLVQKRCYYCMSG
jgi:hypothetical protein